MSARICRWQGKVAHLRMYSDSTQHKQKAHLEKHQACGYMSSALQAACLASVKETSSSFGVPCCVGVEWACHMFCAQLHQCKFAWKCQDHDQSEYT